MSRRCVLLDRDGTIVFERGYIRDPEEIELLPGAAAALRRLAQSGLPLAVVTNQSAVGRGLLTEARLEEIHQRLRELLAAEGVALAGIYFCPHVPEEGCACRKPGTALLERASRELGFLPSESFVIGDKDCDIELGQRAGATAILVRTGYGDEVAQDASVFPDYVADDLAEAASIIERLVAPSPSLSAQKEK
ncbi:MAG TPA: HAD family hydrolase [Thermoanaerobaculia bacterium]